MDSAMLDAGGLNGCSPMHLAAGWRMQQKLSADSVQKVDCQQLQH
jgi:hypothetical protein